METWNRPNATNPTASGAIKPAAYAAYAGDAADARCVLFVRQPLRGNSDEGAAPNVAVATNQATNKLM